MLTGGQDAEAEYLGQEIDGTDGIDDMDEEEEEIVYCTNTCINAVMPTTFCMILNICTLHR